MSKSAVIDFSNVSDLDKPVKGGVYVLRLRSGKFNPENKRGPVIIWRFEVLGSPNGETLPESGREVSRWDYLGKPSDVLATLKAFGETQESLVSRGEIDWSEQENIDAYIDSQIVAAVSVSGDFNFVNRPRQPKESELFTFES